MLLKQQKLYDVCGNPSVDCIKYINGVRASRNMAKILLTGAAGFIGAHTAKALHERGHEVIGIDNFNDYYDVRLKRARVKELVPGQVRVIEGDILDRDLLDRVVSGLGVTAIVHLAAQAGVRYSLEHPDTYIQTNIQGTNNILELARHHGIKKVVYASSSSVYGGNTKTPFSERDRVDTPISLYAASKKANELQAHTYSHLFGITTIGLRFFTVYGPWGRPDMATYLFADAISAGRPIKVFNNGLMERDFTYVDDIVGGIVSAVEADIAGAKVYNLGNAHTVRLDRFISIIEMNLGKEAQRRLLPLQPGDVLKTSADISLARSELGFEPKTSIEEGLKLFLDWFAEYQLRSH